MGRNATRIREQWATEAKVVLEKGLNRPLNQSHFQCPITECLHAPSDRRLASLLRPNLQSA